MIEELQTLVEGARALHCTPCDLTHETYVQITFDDRKLVPECPRDIQRLRPCCPHRFRYEEIFKRVKYDVLRDLFTFLHEKGSTTPLLIEMHRQYITDQTALSSLDVQRRRESDFHDTPADESPAVMEHRAIVARTKAFRDLLVTEAKRILMSHENVETSVVASSS